MGASPEYRALLATNVLTGVSVSSYVPLIALFLVQTLGADEASVGLFMLTFVLAPVVSVGVGRLSDRLRSRVPLIVAVGGWTAIGQVVMSQVPNFGSALVVSVVFGGFAGVVQAQTAALLRDVFDHDREPHEATVASVVRTGYSFGWLVGPVLGAGVAASIGYRTALVVSAVVALGALAPLIALRRVHRPESNPAAPNGAIGSRSADGIAERARGWGGAGLWVFALAVLLGLTGEAVRISFLPILAVDRLALPLTTLGLLLALAPAVELVAMPVAGAIGDRWGIRPVLIAGFVLGVLGFAAFAVGTGWVVLAVGQVLNACFIAIVFGLGSIYVQRLHPERAGFATSVFFAAQSLTVVTGGLVGGGGVALLGLPAMFILPAALCAGGGVLLLVNRSGRPTRR